MDNKSEELTQLTSNTHKTANIISVNDDTECETKSFNDIHDTNISIKQTKRSRKISEFPDRVPVSLSQLRSKSVLVLDELKENEQECFAKCLNSKCCTGIWITIAVFFTAVTFMTPIASIIAGWQINEIFDKYDIETIKTQCDNNWDNITVIHGEDLGGHAYAAFIWGIIDFILLLTQGICLYGYFYKDMSDMDRNVFGILVGVRLFFIIVWLVYASFFFRAARGIEAYCDANGPFYKDMQKIFVWYIPIMGIEVVKNFVVFIVAGLGCCILCCIA
eukprot:424529_1